MLVQYLRSDKTSKLDFTEAAVERRMIDILRSVPSNPAHQLCDNSWQMDGSISRQLIPPKIKMVRFRRSLVPTPIKQQVWPNPKLAHTQTPPTQPDQLHWLFFFFLTFTAAPKTITQIYMCIICSVSHGYLLFFSWYVFSSCPYFLFRRGSRRLLFDTFTPDMRHQSSTLNKTHLPLTFNSFLQNVLLN